MNRKGLQRRIIGDAPLIIECNRTDWLAQASRAPYLYPSNGIFSRWMKERKRDPIGLHVDILGVPGCLRGRAAAKRQEVVLERRERKGRGGFSSRATLSRKIYRRTVGFVATCMGSLLKGSGILKGF